MDLINIVKFLYLGKVVFQRFFSNEFLLPTSLNSCRGGRHIVLALGIENVNFASRIEPEQIPYFVQGLRKSPDGNVFCVQNVIWQPKLLQVSSSTQIRGSNLI